MLHGRDIVMVSLHPWYYELTGNSINMAHHFARNNRVLYVNRPINRKTYGAQEKSAGFHKHCEIIRNKGEQIHRINDNLWEFYPASLSESIKWLPSTKTFKAINYIANRRLAKDIGKAIKKLGFSDIILFNDNEIFNGYNLKELLAPSLYVYYCRDYLRGFEYWKKHCDVLEPELIRKADLTVANSLYLRDYCAGYNQQSYYIGQGCNLELFDAGRKYAQPGELKNISPPLIGYAGNLTAERLDIEIIEGIAAADPSWNVVLLGPEDEAFKKSRLHEMKNVHFLGRKPIDQLPAYIAHFDVCINPQQINPITVGNYPLKVDEYLAMGKPVVATATKTMELFREHTYLAPAAKDYPPLIRKALTEDSAEKSRARIAFAHTHTWDNCMNALYEVMGRFEEKRKGEAVIS